MSLTSKLIYLICLMLISPAVYAADMLPWKTYLLSVMGISLVIASVLSIRNSKVDSLMAKLLLAGLYFWILTFAQLIILALLHYLNG